MSARAVAGIVVAAAALLWTASQLTVVSLLMAEIGGRRDAFWSEFAFECASVALVAILILRAQRWRLDTPALWAWGALSLVSIGIAESVAMLRLETTVSSFKDIFAGAAHMHYATRWAAVFCLFAGLYALFPKITARNSTRFLAKLQFALMLAGFVALRGASLAIRWADMAPRNRMLVDSFVLIGVTAMVVGAAVFVILLALALLPRRAAEAS